MVLYIWHADNEKLTSITKLVIRANRDAIHAQYNTRSAALEF